MTHTVTGVGLGLRWPLFEHLMATPPPELSWLEVAPENYIHRGGRFPAALRRCQEKWPLVTHGLSLSLGGFDPIEPQELKPLREFLKETKTPWHSDHLCFSEFGGIRTHDLLPIPFAPNMIGHVADRIRRCQDALGLPIAIENVSSYAVAPGSVMTEWEFISAVLDKADCWLLLDVNNLFVNSINHNFDAKLALSSLPLDRVRQIHMAGHEVSGELLIDTHAQPIRDEVFELLQYALRQTGPVPVLLERDDNFDHWDHLCDEIARISNLIKEADA